MQVDFYLLNTCEEPRRDHFICRLIEKIYHQRHTLYIHCKDQQEAHRLDELLWSFNDVSFIPHCLYTEAPNPPPTILFGFDSTPMKRDVLINLSTTIPLFYSSFSRILEIVLMDKTQQTIAHEHEQFYQSKNFTIKSHNINT